jgi:hypothetical protein
MVLTFTTPETNNIIGQGSAGGNMKLILEDKGSAEAI